MGTRRFLLMAMMGGVFGILSIGCGSRNGTSSGGSVGSYPDTYSALMVEYGNRVKQLYSRPMSLESASREQKRAIIAQQVEAMADIHAEFASKLRSLNPPPEFAGVHIASVAVFEAGDKPNRQWAEAIRTGSREVSDRASKEAETKQAQAIIQLNQALEQAGGHNEKLRTLVGEMQGAMGR